MIDLEKYKIHRNYLCIDLKSFYASVECKERGFDPFSTPLVVADTTRGNGGVVLAITPYLKQKGYRSRCRYYEIKDDKELIIAKPRMKLYLEESTNIIKTILKYFSSSDIYIYSIDETFIDITNYLDYYKMTDYEMGKFILNEILEKNKIYATCGIGPNMLISKLALDIESKHNEDYIAKWTYDNIKDKLWNVKPLSEMWGIGSRLQKRLNDLGIFKVGDINEFGIEKLKANFGFIGEELFFHIHGIDQSDLRVKYVPHQKSIGQGQTLFRDYEGEEMKVVIREMVDNVCQRLRYFKLCGKQVSLSIGYSKETSGGFSRQIQIEYTQSEDKVFEACMLIFNKYYDNYPIRKLNLSVGQLKNENSIYYNIFDDIEELENKRKVRKAIDEVKMKFGNSVISRGISHTKSGTHLKRSKLVGGHNAEYEGENNE